MSDSATEKSPLDRLLDAGVFAPLGFLLARDKTITDLAEAGRKQIAFTRSLGRAAIRGVARGTQAKTAKTKPHVAKPHSTAAAVDGYEEMTAREIVALLASSDRLQARWILDRETAGKQRVTVTRAAANALD